MTININCIDISSDGNVVVTGDSASQITLWEAKSGKIIKQINGYEDDIVHTVFSHDGNHLLISSMESLLGIWNLPSITKLVDLELEYEIVRDAIFTSDSQKVLACTLSGQILEISTSTGHLLKRWKTSETDMGQLNSIDLDYRMSKLVGGFSSGYLICWELESKKVLWSYKYPESIFNLRVSPDASAVAVATNGLFVHDMDSGRVIQALPDSLPNKIRFSDIPSEILYPEDSNNELVLWDWQKNRVIRKYSGHTKQVYAVSMCPDYVVSGGNDGRVMVRNKRSGSVVWDHILS